MRPDGAPLRIAILGATGSIGRQALDVVSRNPGRLEAVALSARSHAEQAAEAARSCGAKHLAIADAAHQGEACLEDIAAQGVEVSFGDKAVVSLAELPDVDCVLNALVGEAGLRASFAALAAGKRLALANKESLVVGGDLLMPLSRESGELIPVDSEHGAIFQCLLGEDRARVKRIWLTASGGPFYGKDRRFLEGVGKEQALAHPTWHMGPKITIDSATLMNKGLEVIEAHHLFSAGFDDITVLVQPQSCIHSMVEYCDGSVKAHLGVPDMRIPIQFAFSYPDRWESPAPEPEFRTMGALALGAPDMDTFRCLRLAIDAGRAGGTAPCAMNAANEVAVAAFLSGACGFTDIDNVIETTLDAHDVSAVESIAQLEEVDAWARACASDALMKIGSC